MSLHFYLETPVWKSYNKGETWVESFEEVFCDNITHNLSDMAEAVGIYEALWRPYRLKQNYNLEGDDSKTEWKFEDDNKVQAKEIIASLEKGLKKLKKSPEKYKKYDSTNGWGLYINFVPFVEAVLEACREHPIAYVHCSR